MGAHSMREDETAPSWGRMLKDMPLSGQPQNLHIHGRALNSRHRAAEPVAVNERFIQCKTSFWTLLMDTEPSLNSWCALPGAILLPAPFSCLPASHGGKG